MRARHYGLFVSTLLCGFCSQGIADDEQPIPDALQRYVDRAEPVYGWKLLETRKVDGGSVHVLQLVSQTWQDIVWKHALIVYEPEQIDHPDHMLLMVTGGRNGRMPDGDDLAMGMGLARLCGGRIATLHQVPNQPLLGDHVEDDLITETWLKYLETGDDTWPLLFPMVKSAVKAMDALQEFSEEQWSQEVKGFVITGASKRGWTSWLTPVADKRVIATAPIVIDTLNFPAQMKYQIETWGAYSVQIDDYTRKGLVRPEGEPRTPREKALWRMMDPYTYRSQLALPKLIICGTNDPYWVVDALKNYWDDLDGPKYTLQVPNAGHGLDGGRELALTTLGAFFRYAALQLPLPKLDWTFAAGDDAFRLDVTSDVPVKAAKLWVANSNTLDFRDAPWRSEQMATFNQSHGGSVKRPESGHVATFAELQYDAKGYVYSLTTRVFRE